MEFAASVGVRLLEKEGSVLRLHVEPRVVNGGGSGDDSDGDSSDRTPVRVTEEWEVLHILEFTSERKRMSVVLRQISSDGSTGSQDGGQVWLYTKGAG